MTTDDILTGLFTREGRTFTNDPSDHGGPTKYGITLRDLRAWRKDPTLTAGAVEVLTEPEARAIYHARYIVDPGFLSVAPDWVRVFLIDTGVLQGPRVAVKLLQRALEVDADGVLGPVTLAALAGANLDILRTVLLRARLQHLVACALADVPPEVVGSTNLQYLRGWINRVLTFL